MTDVHPLKRNKFGAVKTVYGGLRYDSKREAEVARELDMLRLAQDPHERVYKIERQFRIRIEVNGKPVCEYRADFFVVYADGRKELIEVKGFWTPESRLKRKLLEATFLLDHPDISYRVIR